MSGAHAAESEGAVTGSFPWPWTVLLHLLRRVRRRGLRADRQIALAALEDAMGRAQGQQDAAVPDPDCFSPAMDTCLDLRPVMARPYIGDDNAWWLS